MKKISSIIVIDWKYLLIITLIVLIFFLPVFFKGWIIFPDLLDHYQPWSNYVPGLFIRYSPLRSDLVDSYLPKFNYIKTSTLQGDIPLWFDAADLGKPMSHYLSQYMFTPFIFLMWLLPVEIGFTASVILKALTAAIGMFYWLKSLGVNSGLAVGGGVAFVFSGFHISWFMAAAGMQNMMLPWVFLLADYLLSSKEFMQKYWRMFWLSIVLSAILFSGFVAGAGHILYLLGFYVLIRSIISAIKQQPKSFPEIRSAIMPGLMVLASIVMAVGLAAIFLLPSIEWVEFIDVSYRKVSNASAFLPLKTLIQLGLPNYFGNPVFNNWKGVANWNETSSFVTILCLVATPIGLLYGIKKKQLTISVVGLLAILCFLIIWKITPLLSIVRKLPIFDSSSNVRLIGPLDFFLITIGVYGLNAIMHIRRTRLYVVYFNLVITLLAVLLIYKYTYLRGLDIASLTLADHNLFVVLTIIFALAIFLSFMHIFWLYRMRFISEASYSRFISLLLIADSMLFSYRQIPFVPRTHFYPETKQIEFLHENLENGRLLIFDGLFMISGTQIFYGLDSVLTHNLHTVREKELVTLFSTDAWATATAPMLSSINTDFTSPMFEFYGVKFIVVAENRTIDDPTWKLVLSGVDGANTYENTQWSDQRYHFSSQIMRFNSLEDFEKNLDAVSTGEIIYYESELPQLPDISSVHEAISTIEVITDSGDYNELKVCTDHPGILSVRDSYWPDWKITISGALAATLRTNYIYRGVYLEKGCSTVIEEYLPVSLRIGMILSGVSLTILIILLILGIYSQRKQKVTKINRITNEVHLNSDSVT